MMIGVSLGMNLLCGGSLSEAQRLLVGQDTLDSLMNRLKSEGVTHIEMRAVHSGESAERIIAAAERIIAGGFSFTVHGELREYDPEGFVSQLKPLLDLQSDITVTVHPVRNSGTAEENIKATANALRRLSRLDSFIGSGIKIAVENCRMSNGPDISLLPDGVLESIVRADCGRIGTCWDFGHFRSDRISYPDVVSYDLPSVRFAEKTIHTHIHDESGSTHFPLGTGSLPLEEYVSLLCGAGYNGVYNLELEPERWYKTYPDVREKYIQSIRILRDTLVKLQNREKTNYESK